LQAGAEGEAPGTSSKGFDATNIRGDSDERDPEDRTWQPLPDAFVAAMGEFCLRVSGELRPLYHSFLSDLIQSDPSASSFAEIALAAQAYAWPEGFEVTNIPTAKKVGNVCQFSAMFLLALLLGPRSSEITALPLGLVKELSDGTHVINGSTFKLSQSTTGRERDWPIHADLGKALVQQEEYIRLVEGAFFRFLFRSHDSVAWGNKPVRQLNGTLSDMVKHAGLERLLDGSSFHPHRLRKTTARLIVIALHGGPLILRRLFGHQHLAMTLRYILTNQGIVDELRAIAEEEQRAMAADFVKRRKELKGGGASGFNAAVSTAEQVVQQLPEVFIPEGRREQAKVTMDQIIEVLAADRAEGLRLKQIVPGLIVCWKPSDEAGMCCKAGELPNIAKCSTKCNWHLQMPEYQDEARKDVQAALEHIKDERIGSLKWHYYSGIVSAKLADYPELRAEFASHPLLGQVVENIP
jgi:hypothetical protein